MFNTQRLPVLERSRYLLQNMTFTILIIVQRDATQSNLLIILQIHSTVTSLQRELGHVGGR